MKEFVKSESGQAMVQIVLCMTVLLGFLGLAIDVGLLYRAKQEAQTAADAAATAAALDYLYNQSASSAQTVGKAASAANGYQDGSGGVTVTVNVPPASGPNTSGNFAEAIVAKSNPLNFFQILGFSSATAQARAVAGMPVVGNICIWLMAASGTGMHLQGSYSIHAPSCGVYVNSTSSNAISITGNGGTITASFIDVVGNVTPSHQTSPTPITSNTAPRKNPWGNLSGPSVPGSCNITSSATSITTANQASVSGSSSSKVVCFTKAVTLNNGVSLPGANSGIVYVFENGVTIPTGATVSLGSGTYDSSTGTFSNTSGAVMDLYSGTLSQASNSILNVYSPTAGPDNGVAILQPASNTADLQVQFGSNNQVLDGYIYAPGAEVYLQDHGGGITAAGIVADSLYDKSSSITIPSYDAANLQTTPNRVITLVE